MITSCPTMVNYIVSSRFYMPEQANDLATEINQHMEVVSTERFDCCKQVINRVHIMVKFA